MQCLTIYIYAGFAHGTKNDDAFDGNNNIRVRETTFENRTPNQPFDIEPYQYKKYLTCYCLFMNSNKEVSSNIISSTQIMVFKI